MTELLEKAFAKVSELPEKEQNEIASLILEEIADEEKWQKSFANSKAQLETLGEEALKEYKLGKTRSFP
jgi:7,8-dihydro-6-hydroxymethylpterin-pyrophosphokinase